MSLEVGIFALEKAVGILTKQALSDSKNYSGVIYGLTGGITVVPAIGKVMDSLVEQLNHPD
ncbi:MAG: hypothetical protein HRK26_00895 [Rickettsiaceae bacterium H1]|nr:hypothetical protein [Rickettsiaceae bacterium H1]